MIERTASRLMILCERVLARRSDSYSSGGCWACTSAAQADSDSTTTATDTHIAQKLIPTNDNSAEWGKSNKIESKTSADRKTTLELLLLFG